MPPSEPDPVARRTRLAPDERRRQILACARRLFSERGYAGVSTEEIAQAAGVRRGLLNHYFGTKRELFLEVVAAQLRLTVQPLWSPAPDRPLDEAVDASVARWLDVVEANADMWFAVLGAEGFGRDAELEAMLEQARDSMVERVIGALGVADADDSTRAVMRTYAALAEETSRQWLVHGRLTRTGAHTLLAAALVTFLSDVAPAVRASQSIAPAPR